MAHSEISEQELNPELWHMYAADKGHCPDTWNRELGEWQFDGVDQSGAIEPGRKRTMDGSAHCNSLSALQKELAKWLPAT